MVVFDIMHSDILIILRSFVFIFSGLICTCNAVTGQISNYIGVNTDDNDPKQSTLLFPSIREDIAGRNQSIAAANWHRFIALELTRIFLSVL